MNLKNFESVVKNTPLETRLSVINQMTFIELLTQLGYREGFWTGEEEEKLARLIELSQIHTKNILKTFNDWEKDGSPV